MNLSSSVSGGTPDYIFSWTGPNGYTSNLQNPSILNVTTAASGTYNLIVTDANGCTTTASTSVTVNPLTLPTVTIYATPGSNICSGTSVTFAANIGNYGLVATYEWLLNGNPVGTNSTYTSSTLVNGNVISLRVTADNTVICPGTTTSNSITMTVNPSIIPTVTITGPSGSVCPGSNATFSVSGSLNSGISPTYQWQISTDGTTWTNITGATGTSYTSNSLTDGNIIRVQMTSSIPCSVNPATSNTVTVSLYPIPTLSTTLGDQVYCQGVATNPITLSGTPAGVVFDITGGTAIGLLNQTGVTEIPSFPPIPGTATITVAPRANGCSGTPVTFNITVYPTPAATSPGNQIYCPDVLTSLITLSGTPSGVLFDITGGASVGLLDQTGVTAIPPFNPIAGNATVTITPRANNCTGTPVNFNITVNLEPTVDDPQDQIICNGSSTTAIVFTGTGTSYSWTNDNTSIGLAATGTGNIPSFTCNKYR